LPRRVTRRSIMQKVRGRTGRSHGASTACRLSVSGTISLPSLGCFSPFPHGTSSLSVTREYLALEGGPPRFRQGFTCPVLLGIRLARSSFRLPGCHRLWRTVPSASTNRSATVVDVPQPLKTVIFRFGLVPVRSPLLRESQLLSFPAGNEMFQFPALAPLAR
jgi:hypothetical protein